MTSIAELGLAVNSESVVQATGDLDKFVDSGARAESAADKVGSAWDKSAQKSASSSKKATAATDEQREALEKLLGQIDPTVGALGRLDQMQEKLTKFKAAGILPADDFADYTAKIDRARTGLSRFDEGLARAGNSAKQNAAALRMLPAQFSDIIISLQGGQAPLTVFMQQGSQIKDSFGGAGAAVKAMGGYVAGMVNPLTVGAAAAGIMAAVFYDAEKQVSAFNKSLFSGTATSGQTASSLAAISTVVSAVTGDISEANAAVIALAGSAKLSQTQFVNLAQASASIAEFTGTSAAEVAKALGGIGGNATKAAEKISSQYGLLTSAQYEVIAALDEQGKKQEALDALSGYLNDNAQKRLLAYKGSLSDVEKGWNSIGTAISNAYSKVKAELFPDLGKQAEIIERILKTREDGGLAGALSTGLSKANSFLGLADGNNDDSTEALQKRLALIKQRIALGQQEANIQGESGRAEQAKIEATGKWNSEQKASLTGLAKLEDDINEKRKLGIAAGRSQAEIEKEVTALRDKYDKSQPKGKVGAVDLTSFNDADNKLKALTASFQNSMRVLDASQKAGLISQQQYAEQKSALIGKEKTEVEAAYNGQITALEAVRDKSTTTGAQRIQIDQKISDSKSKMVDALKKLDADQEVLSIELRGRLEKDEAAVKAFAQATQDSLKLDQRGLDSQLAGFGLSDQQRKRLQEDLKIQQDYQDKLEKLSRDRSRNQISESVYQQETQILNDALATRLQKQEDFYRKEDALRGDWSNGVSRAWRNYVEEANDAAGLTESAFGNAFQGIEDVFVDFITTGKASFKDFANSVIADLARIVVKQQVIAPLLNAVFGSGGGNGASSFGGAVGSMLGGNSVGDSNGWGGMVSLGKNLYSAWSNLTGVGSSIASGYASGGVSGAISGGAGYYGNMLSNIASTLSGGFTSLIGGNIAITGATAAGTAATTAALTGVTAAQAAAAAATVGAEGITAAALQGAIAEGAASIGTNIGVAGATTAAASQGIAASISGALSSAAAMWPLAVIMGMYQSGKLYDAGVRPSMSEMQATGGDTALGKATMAPIALQSGIMELTDKINSKLVGGKLAAIISGSTLHQAVWGAVGKKLFGGAWETKDGGISLGVDDGELDAKQYIYQKKKGGLFSSSKKRTRYSALDAETEDALGSAYNEKILNSMGLFSALGVQLSETVLDGLNVAASKISTKGKTAEAVQEELDKWFAGLGDSAVSAINTATSSGLDGFSFEGLTSFVNNLYSVNATVKMLGIKALDMSVSGGRAVETMISLSGTIDTLNTGLSAYYDGFTTDIEKTANSLSAARSAFTQFGFTLPDTRDGLKAVVQALDLTTDVGQNMLVAITKNADAATAAYAILEARESAYRSAFFSEAENTALAIKGTTAELKALGVTLPASRSEYRKMVEEAAKSTTDTGKAMYDTLMNAAGAASTVFDELERRLNQGVTDSFSGVQRSISAQQKAATAAYNATNTSLSDMSATAVKSVTDLSSVSNSLESALKSLRGTSDDAVKTLRAQAQTTLQSALAAARAGGSLSGFSGLEDALDTVSSNNTDLYSSMEDFARDQGRTANVVAELNAINGKQLTAAEKLQKSLEDQIGVAKAAYDAQMAQFDQQLEFAQAQMDAFNGIDTSVKSVEAAIKALNGSLIASLAAKPATGAGSAMANTAANNATVVDTLYQQLFGRTADAGENKYWADRLGSGNLPYAEIVANMTQYASAADKAAMAAMGKVPAYASGGDHLGGLRLVGENGPELEVTGPSRIYNANQTASMLNGGGGNGELIAEVRQLRTENRQAQFQIVKLTQKIEQTMSQWNGEGMPQEREYAL